MDDLRPAHTDFNTRRAVPCACGNLSSRYPPRDTENRQWCGDENYCQWDDPGPTLRFVEGEEVVIVVTNHLEEASSIHWHGLLLPGAMDGVPGFNGFEGIKPGTTFTYRFKVRQSGTYWYHAHSRGQEQDGLYGAIIVRPKDDLSAAPERDYVVLISDFHTDGSEEIMANLKKSSDYYQYHRPTVGHFLNQVKTRGWSDSLKALRQWGRMRMLPSDLADVSGYVFLINGKTAEENWNAFAQPGERVRLRFINASASSFYDVRIPGLSLKVVAADGQNIEPVDVDEFRFGAAETYDVIVQPTEDKAYTIVAESLDRTGFALATIASRPADRGVAPTPRPRPWLSMADMAARDMARDMRGDMRGDRGSASSHTAHGPNRGHEHMPDGTDMGQAGMDASAHQPMVAMGESGWADHGAPAGQRILSYADLRYRGEQTDIRPPDRTLDIRLGGNMERYIWTMNGQKFSQATPLALHYGERVRINFINDTMMAHPMHLHGMFMQLENGQPARKQPNKHTVIIPPGQSYSVLLTADEAGEWAFHCHLLYHMMAGMMTKLIVARLDPEHMPQAGLMPPALAPQSDQPTMQGAHHGH